MDFFKIKEKLINKQHVVAPKFFIEESKDFMVRGRSFYAIWDEEKRTWSKKESDVVRIIDNEIRDYIAKSDKELIPSYLRDFDSKSWRDYKSYLSLMFDTNKQLDSKVTFLSDETKLSDYSSRRLPYDIRKGSIKNYFELIGTLFNESEREKLEWAVGSIFAGDSVDIQKFIVLYGEGGTGKSTFLNIVQMLFEGYWVTFDAKGLTGNSNTFSMEKFRDDPLVAIQHDGDLSRISDNTKLNSIVSHEMMTINEKFKSSYDARANCFLFMGTNSAVMITDSKSGLIRRLIDVYPSGNKVSSNRYFALMEGIKFELGAIADHCLEVYRMLGKNYYANYKPYEMMYQTNVFYNFVEDSYLTFASQDETTLKQAYELYKNYCTESGLTVEPKYKVKVELKAYFEEYEDRSRTSEGKQVWNKYKGFLKEKFMPVVLTPEQEEKPISLVLDISESLFDKEYADQPAQYANSHETPSKKWDDVVSKLSDLDTTKIHYVKLPEAHIVIDFDIRDESGEKSIEMNLEAAAKFPPTYTEFSKSGAGVHMHYIYDGDVSRLMPEYAEHVEIKIFKGNSSLRRKLSRCNNVPIAHISSGLPLREEAKVINKQTLQSEQGLRQMIQRNLNKEFHPGTKPSIDFIDKILNDAYASGLTYDVCDMQMKILSFATQSTNQSEYCVKLVSQMKFKSKDNEIDIPNEDAPGGLVFFDIEVFPNLFVVVWKEQGEDKKFVKMINPSPDDIEGLLKMKLVGFNNRRYDNHILYARLIGYDNEQLYKLSQKIINGGKTSNALFREGYNLSYTDIYDFTSKKQSLKKYEIELGIHHQELGYEWDQPVPEENWEKVADYCINDVIATEKTFEARKQDWIARIICSELSGLSTNHTTQQHTAKIIFGDDPKPQEKFIYTDLSEMFPGYSYDPMRTPKSLYRGEDPSEGGRVFANPGMYIDVALLDIQSMHPWSLINMNAFGPYTANFKALLDARVAIKHKNYDLAKTMLNGVLTPYLNSVDDAKDLSYALKIVINIVYGLTSASFENKFLDPRNKDNIVAKRGALFMIDLQKAIEAKGWELVHIKTDSVKVANATPEIIDFIMEFGKQYGYIFEHEATYEKMCLVNNAVYIAKYGWAEDERDIGKWTATGAEFAHPYIFKKLFSHERLDFADYAETKEVKSAMYLDFNEGLDISEHNYVHVGKVGSFIPVKSGGGVLLRKKNDKYYAVTGTKGYRWMEAEVVSDENTVDMSYYITLLDDSKANLSRYGDLEWFLSKDAGIPRQELGPIGFEDIPPLLECGRDYCDYCPQYENAKCKLGYSCQSQE